MTLRYCYYFKNTYYFRKMIHHKYIKNRTSNLNYRRSLKLCMEEDFYYYLESNKDELIKLLNNINENLTRFLKEQIDIELTVPDINQFINKTVTNYINKSGLLPTTFKDNPPKENEKVNKTNKNQYLQILTVKFKELDYLCKNLDKYELRDKIRIKAIEVIKQSDMSFEDVLSKVSVDNLQRFYEMTVKSRKDVIQNDLKTYVRRNIELFYPLVPIHITEDIAKVEEAYYQYINLVSKKPIQKNYLKLIRDNAVKNENTDSLNDKTQEQLMSDIISILNQENNNTSHNNSLEINSLIKKYIDFRDSSKTVRKRQVLSLNFLKEFLNGNGTTEHPTLKLKDLTENDIKRFTNLFSNATPKSNKKTRMMNLFQLAEYRVKNDLDRYKNNTLEMMQYDIQNFWKYVCKYIDNRLNPSLFDAFDILYLTSQAKYKDKQEDSKLRGFTSNELQTFIDVAYSEDKLRRILTDSPRNFFCFFFAYMLGTRIAEFTYIRTSDIKKQIKEGEIAYYIYLNEDIAPQSLKNKNAHRNIPIPKVLIELGFLNYLNLRIKREKEWLWDFSSSGYGSISVFFQRHIKNLFPKEKRELQLRSLRKNFASKVFSEDYHTKEKNPNTIKSLEQNLKRIMGHAEGSTTGVYLDRIEPIVGKNLLDTLGDYDLNLEEIKSYIRNYYQNILTNIDSIDSSFNWKKKSNIKPKKGRRV